MNKVPGEPSRRRERDGSSPVWAPGAKDTRVLTPGPGTGALRGQLREYRHRDPVGGAGGQQEY